MVAEAVTGGILRKEVYYAQTGYFPHEGQVMVHTDGTRHRVLRCGRRWGKTLAGAKEVEPNAFVRNWLGEAQRGWIVGPEYSDCEKEFRVIYDTFRKLGIDGISGKFLNNVENGNMHIRTNWGFDLECRSARHPESLVGEGLDFVLLVEAGRHQRRTWAQYIRPALSDKRGWSFISGVPEGASQTSLLYALSQRGEDPRYPYWKSFCMPSWTNNVVFPGGRMDPEILEAESDLTEDEFNRQYGAQFVERAGRVMKEWDDEVHITDLEYRPDLPLYAAIDYGYTNDWVILWIQVDRWNNVNVLAEQRFKFKDTAEIAEELKDSALVRQLVRFYPDPARPDDTNILNRVWKKPANTNTGGELLTRLSLIRNALKLNPDDVYRPKLLVDRRCGTLIWEMREGYRWPEHKSEVKNDSEKPMDKDDHGPEALGRFFKGYFGGEGTTRRTRMSKARIG